jgi:hypothetical protein
MRSTWSPPALFLVLLMGVGSIIMWIGVPLGLIYGASKLADTSAPTLGPYLLVFIGLPIGMAIMAKLLGHLDRVHQAYTRTGDDRPQQAPWMRSMRGERGSTRKRGVLDTVMIVSVGLALVVFGIWFFGFAGSSLPGS